jgi:hypothetical protein
MSQLLQDFQNDVIDAEHVGFLLTRLPAFLLILLVRASSIEEVAQQQSFDVGGQNGPLGQQLGDGRHE